MIFCARATRGRGLPSLGIMARLGVPVDGRVRRLRTVEAQLAPIPKEISRKLGSSIYIVGRAQVGSSHPTPYGAMTHTHVLHQEPVGVRSPHACASYADRLDGM